MRKVTLKKIEALNPCDDYAVERFREVFPNGCYPTMANVKLALSESLNLDWLVVKCYSIFRRAGNVDGKDAYREWVRMDSDFIGSDRDCALAAKIIRLALEELG